MYGIVFFFSAHATMWETSSTQEKSDKANATNFTWKSNTTCKAKMKNKVLQALIAHLSHTYIGIGAGSAN